MALQIEIKGNKIKAPLQGYDVWLIAKPEEIIRQKYIYRLVNNYGFKLEQMEQEILVSNTKRGTGGARADIIVYKNIEDKRNRKDAKIIVECKADNITILPEDYFQPEQSTAMLTAEV